MILHTAANLKPVKRILRNIGVPPDDIDELVEKELWLQLLPMMLCVSAWFITILHTYIAHYGFAAFSRLIGLACFWVPQTFLNFGRAFQLALNLVSILVALSVCGTIGICISYILLIAKVMRLYYVSAKYGMKTEWSKYNIYFILALIYMWLIIINAPALVVWATGVHLRSSFQLLDDPSRISGFLSTMLAAVLLLKDSFPQESYSVAVGMRWTIYLISVIMLPFCLIHIYRINAAVHLVLGLVAVASLPGMVILRANKDRAKDE
ncbi:hypothetical protein C0Q70_00529 [Pomacea canaliculata]|uniref:Uncharacterized protein n=2 Tax=Pomacea canaliculata TaxID=400727 RepID=A0A2T7PX16_POMCA|nr:hypothetical protein C0Q70_00529 [Pomacea canaliculata]